jgi:outer membrane lipoprotein-sorting protein
MRRRGLATACVALLVVLAGCGALGDGGDGGDGEGMGPSLTVDDEPPVEQRVADATGDVRTYAVDFRMNLTANGETLQLTQAGVYNRTGERARLNMSVYGTPATSYFVGETAYVNAGGQWQVQNLSGSGLWGENGTLARQRALLETGEVSVVGNETVDGVATTVYAVDADPAAFESLLGRQSGTTGTGTATVQNASYRLYVADETDRPRKAELSTTVSTQGQSSRANVTILFSDYGEPVDVTLPDDAPTGESA